MRKKAEQQRKNISHERYEYFSGKADPDVYVENPFPKKIRDKDTMQKYLDADETFTVCLKIDYYDTMLVYIESILKQISNRTYQIKNAIEFMRFNAGLDNGRRRPDQIELPIKQFVLFIQVSHKQWTKWSGGPTRTRRFQFERSLL